MPLWVLIGMLSIGFLKQNWYYIHEQTPAQRMVPKSKFMPNSIVPQRAIENAEVRQDKQSIENCSRASGEVDTVDSQG